MNDAETLQNDDYQALEIVLNIIPYKILIKKTTPF